MDHGETKQLAEQVGCKLRQIRNEKKLSLNELAEMTDVSKLTLGKIERGEANPTLAIMWKIAKGLSVPLTALLNLEEKVSISRAGEGDKLESSNGDWTVEPIFSNLKYGVSELYRVCIKPQGENTEQHHEGAIEVATVMSGSIDIYVEGCKHHLNTFDSIRFQADSKHTYMNPNDFPVILLCTLSYPRA
ncbi:transcriptional regulator with XRE-family HTH domain [Scopulibacillus daqui]|uniref:Transcriptional regulator with XRE-family HTH domain n=1 Tax=Scopulibacillus daqui TaxID=1469162 RepID=A0ABS2Q2Z7_9BACL|nr:XRE family transcriptional regulator [Scopulibacillus daqui]MBM7646664.1 transcriptional regulator with XRE-family HTH domain [Scopulibacillus daqui]